MAQVITIAGERLFALKAQNNQQLDIDTFIFAFVPGQDSSAPIDRNEGLPPIGQRVHTQIVQQTGLINENAVVYSTVLDSLTGPFDFNWVGLYSSVNQTLIGIIHTPTVSKTVTVPGAAGNILNRNFVIEYSGIAELTGITVDAETWQLDYTARLNGMDELTRQLAADMNGKDWFIDDGFKVVPRSTLNTFKVTAGAGYVSGLRVTLAADHILTLGSYPQFVYVDAWFDGTSESVWKGHTAFTVTNAEMDDYIDVNGRNHYVFKLASITAADVVEDLRGEGAALAKEELSKPGSNVLIAGEPAKEIALLSKKDDYTKIKDSVSSVEALLNSLVQNRKTVVITGDSLSFNAFGYDTEFNENGGGYATDNAFGLSSWAHLLRDTVFTSHSSFKPVNLCNLQTDALISWPDKGTYPDIGINVKAAILRFRSREDRALLYTGYSGAPALIVSYAPANIAVKFKVNGVEFDNTSPDGNYRGRGYFIVPFTGYAVSITDVRLVADGTAGELIVYGCGSTNMTVPKLTGKGAWTSAQILDEYEDLVGKYKPDIIFYIIGANDIGNVSPAIFSENVKSFISNAKEDKPSCEIILISTPPSSSYTRAKAKEFIKAAREIVDETDNVSLIDLWSSLEHIHPSEYRYDNIHFNTDGDTLVFDIIKQKCFPSYNIDSNKFKPCREAFLGAQGTFYYYGHNNGENAPSVHVVSCDNASPQIVSSSPINRISKLEVSYISINGLDALKVVASLGSVITAQTAFIRSFGGSYAEIKLYQQLSDREWTLVAVNAQGSQVSVSIGGLYTAISVTESVI